MLSLILLNEQIYHELKHRIIASQPVRAVALGLLTHSIMSVICCIGQWSRVLRTCCNKAINDVTLPIYPMSYFLQAQKQARLASCLDKLMTDVQRNLEAKNRDKFTQVCVRQLTVLFAEQTWWHIIDDRLRLACTHAESDHSAA